MKSICALIAVRNEAAYLPTILSYLAKQGVEVFITDYGSTDDTLEIVNAARGSPVVGVRQLKHPGFFDLGGQLHAKEEIIKELKHDWIVHQDTDEILQSNVDGETLAEMIDRIDEMGKNVVDFDEFLFLPDTASGYPDGDFFEYGRRYYFFQPWPSRLNRAFKRSEFLTFGDSGGHAATVRGERHLENSCVLRHYIVLSEAHAIAKYVGRSFNSSEVAKGWHANRLNITPASLSIERATPHMLMLTGTAPSAFSREDPKKKHFWQW